MPPARPVWCVYPALGSGHPSLTGSPQTHRLKESVAPVLSVLTECARLHRPARKFLKAQVPRGWARPGTRPPQARLTAAARRCCPRLGT